MNRFQTKYKKEAINKDVANYLFKTLKNEVKWTDGIKTKNGGFTRKAFPVDPDSTLMEELLQYVDGCLNVLSEEKFVILGIYLNLYENGDMYTPSHKHPNTYQLVISLGGTRTLTVGKKEYKMENGDAIIFGSSTHSVPKENNVVQPRISIAS